MLGADFARSSVHRSASEPHGKILVYDTPEGSAMAYHQPAEMLAEWDIPADAPVLNAMSRTLGAVTAGAAR